MSEAFKPLLARLADGATLSEEDAQVFFSACLRGEPTPAQVAAALTLVFARTSGSRRCELEGVLLKKSYNNYIIRTKILKYFTFLPITFMAPNLAGGLTAVTVTNFLLFRWNLISFFKSTSDNPSP